LTTHGLTSNAINDAFNLGRAMELSQARFWFNRHTLEKEKSEASHVADAYI